MKKEIIRYSFTLIAIMLIAFFVYPTPYRYDKLEQKYPVRINRITGDAKFLTTGGWKDVSESRVVVSPPSMPKPDNNLQSFQEQSSLKIVTEKSKMLDVSDSEVIVGDLKFTNLKLQSVNLTGKIYSNIDKRISLYRLSFETYDENGNVLPDQPKSFPISKTVTNTDYAIYSNYIDQTFPTKKYVIVVEYMKLD